MAGVTVQLQPADLGPLRRFGDAAERGRERLTAEADTEDRGAPAVRGAEGGELRLDPGERSSLVHTPAAAHGDDEVGAGEVGEWVRTRLGAVGDACDLEGAAPFDEA